MYYILTNPLLSTYYKLSTISLIMISYIQIILCCLYFLIRNIRGCWRLSRLSSCISNSIVSMLSIPSLHFMNILLIIKWRLIILISLLISSRMLLLKLITLLLRRLINILYSWNSTRSSALMLILMNKSFSKKLILLK